MKKTNQAHISQDEAQRQLRKARHELEEHIKSKYPNIYLAELELWHKSGSGYRNALELGTNALAELPNDEIVDYYRTGQARRKKERET